jgi:hypothetical protein
MNELEIEKQRVVKLKKGLAVSLVSLLVLPLGVFLGAVGMCAGPSSKQNAFLLLFVGIAGISAAGYAAFRVLRGVRYGGWPLRVMGLMSLGVSVLAGLIGWMWAAEAIQALKYF